MDNFISSVSERMQKSYINGFKLGMEHGNIETFRDPAKKQKIIDEFTQLCELEQCQKDEINAINNFECTVVDKFDREISKTLLNIKNNAPKIVESENYIKFLTDFDECFETDPNATHTNLGDDIEMENVELVTIDPFSKMQIEDPVRNKHCNHIYDRKTVLEAIRKGTRCAYMGCSNKKKIAIDDLKDDEELRHRLHRFYTQQQEESD